MSFYSYILLFLCFAGVLGDCPAAYNPRDIFTGFFLASTVSNVDLNINQTIGNYNYQMETPFTRVPQVAIATSVIEGPLRIDQYYRISVNPSTNQILFSVNISYGTNNWQFIRIDFMAETRTDMELGVYQSAVTNFGSTQQFRTTLTSSISNPVVVTFVSGFQVSSLSNSSYSISITNAVASGNGLNFSITTNFLKTVYVSYIVYDSTSLQKSYLVAQGSASLGISSVNNSKFLAGTTKLFGFNSFVSSSNNYFDYSSRVSSQLSFNITTKTISSISVSYIIIETLPSEYCTNCTSGNIYQEGYCVMMCDSSAVPATQNSAQTCIICDIENFMIKTQDNSSCVCAIQYFQPAGSPSCVACSSSCVTCKGPNANDCTSCDLTPSVGTNRVLVNGSCNCISKYYSNANTGYSCVACHYSCLTCSGTANTNCLSCSVSLGRNLIGNACTCRSGYTDNGQSQACVCTTTLPNGSCSVPITCQQNQVVVNNICQCSTGYFNISGTCSQCSSNQYFSNGVCSNCTNGQVSSSRTECTCNSGFYKIGGVCQQCRANEVYSNSTNNCVCASGYFSVNGSCQKPPTNQVYNGSTFVCGTGFFNISGVCSTCQGNQVYNSTTQTCGCTQNLILINGACQTRPVDNTTNNNNNTNNNTTNNQTQPCPANSIRTNGNCICLNGFYNMSGSCTSCPQNGYFNGQVCVCYPGYYNISGNCTNNPTCTGQFQYFNGATCVCYPGYSNNSGACTYGCGTNQMLTQAGCQCATGFYNISGSCSSCPTNSYYNGAECLCTGGLFLINNTCTSCGLNSAYNGSACVCAQGTYNISGSCQSCPLNSIYNGSACVCNSGYTMNQNTCVSNNNNNTNTNTTNTTDPNNSQCGFGSWNGFQCVCNQGYYLIQNKCNVCPNSAYFNGQTCICYGGTNYINGTCTTCPNFSYFNGVTCACYGGLVFFNNNCVSCPTNSYSSGTSCQCSFGTYSNASNTCIVCNSPATFNGSTCVCPSGYYMQQNSCVVCSRGCSVCSSANVCTTCSTGFTLNSGVCSETSTTPTTPTNKVNITNQGFTIYTGYVGAAIALNPFPPALQINNCQLCGNVLQTTIVSGASPQILAGFSPPSTLHVLFGFGLSQMRPFVASVGINPQYSSYFPGMDISTRITLNVTQNVINGRG